MSVTADQSPPAASAHSVLSNACAQRRVKRIRRIRSRR